MKKEETKSRTYKTINLVYIALSAALLTISAWISIPLTVPFTLQTFAVCLIAGLFGSRRATAAVAVYLLLGVVGLPVFAGFKGGIGSLLGTTGGYLIGFLFTTIIAGLASERLGRKLPVLIVSMILGVFVCYVFGTAWFMYLYLRDTGAIALSAVLSACVFPFIIPDLVKIFLAAVLSRRLARFVK